MEYTLKSGIDVPSRLLIFRKKSTQDNFIPDPPFIDLLLQVHTGKLSWADTSIRPVWHLSCPEWQDIRFIRVFVSLLTVSSNVQFQQVDLMISYVSHCLRACMRRE